MPTLTTPDDVLELANSFFAPRALMAGANLGVFAALADGPRDGAEVAARIGADARATGILLRALVAVGVLALVGGAGDERFALTDLARECLVPGSPRDLSMYLGLDADTFASWARVEDAVRTGRPIEVSSHAAAHGDAERHRRFITAMRSTALGNAPIVAGGLDLAALIGRKPLSLLDLGAGPGTYAAAFARRWPGLRVTLLDLPETIAIAREQPDVAAAGAAFLAGDFHRDPLGGPYDVAWLSHVVHGHPEAAVGPLLGRVREALAPGGAVAIHDFVLDRTRTRPAFAAVFALNFAVMSDRGRCYSLDELRGLLERAGFEAVEPRDLGEPRGISVVVARRPRTP